MSPASPPGPEEMVADESLDLKASCAPDTESSEELDSEPRRRWKPNPELLRALAEARRDLKPGESSLYWDWTHTRDAAPEAEDVRPSGEGEVFVHERAAAAAYIPPVEVAPAVPPRQCTKSRIRVRDDVDPRRQPTVRTARDSRPSSAPDSPVATFRDATDSAPPSSRPGSPSWPAMIAPGTWPPEDRCGERPVFAPSEGPGMAAPDRRRRFALALFVGVVSGTLAFLWLRASSERSLPVGPAAGPTCAVDDRPGPSPGGAAAPLATAEKDTSPPMTRADGTTGGAPSDPNTSSTNTDPPAPSTRAPGQDSAPPKGPSTAAPRDGKKAAPRTDAHGTPRAPGATEGGGGFLIRKKGPK